MNEIVPQVGAWYRLPDGKLFEVVALNEHDRTHRRPALRRHGRGMGPRSLERPDSRARRGARGLDRLGRHRQGGLRRGFRRRAARAVGKPARLPGRFRGVGAGAGAIAARRAHTPRDIDQPAGHPDRQRAQPRTGTRARDADSRLDLEDRAVRRAHDEVAILRRGTRPASSAASGRCAGTR